MIRILRVRTRIAWTPNELSQPARVSHIPAVGPAINACLLEARIWKQILWSCPLPFNDLLERNIIDPKLSSNVVSELEEYSPSWSLPRKLELSLDQFPLPVGGCCGYSSSDIVPTTILVHTHQRQPGRLPVLSFDFTQALRGYIAPSFTLTGW